MAEAGVSTLGCEVYQAESTDQNKVTEGSAYKQLHRVNSIGEASVTPENIDASALEDKKTRYVKGRDTVSDAITVTINTTDETLAEWIELQGKTICLFVNNPNIKNYGFFVVVTVPDNIPFSGVEQNSLQTLPINCTLNNYIGWDDKVEIPTTASATNETETTGTDEDDGV